MRSLIPLAWLLFAVQVAQAQNLVANGSFEEYDECPTNLGQVTRSVGWTILSQSPDYFNRCNSNDSVAVPLNVCGHQEAYDGDAYMGMVTYLEGIPTYRECIQAQLVAPLIPGVPVYISMMVSPGGFGNDPANNSIRYASSGIGVKFSMQEYTTWSVWEGNVAMSLDSVLRDTAVWLPLNTTYIPDSAYEFIAIGSFFADGDIEVEELDQYGQWNAAYAFVDDVCVSYSSLDCSISNGITGSPTSFEVCGANPVSDELRLCFNGFGRQDSATLELVDVIGRRHKSWVILPGMNELRWSMTGLPSGPYFIVLTSRSSIRETIRILHVQP